MNKVVNIEDYRAVTHHDNIYATYVKDDCMVELWFGTKGVALPRVVRYVYSEGIFYKTHKTELAHPQTKSELEVVQSKAIKVIAQYLELGDES